MNLNDLRIKTCFINPTIPIRNFDWIAWIDGEEEYHSCNGVTELEAKNNLVTGLQDSEFEKQLTKI